MSRFFQSFHLDSISFWIGFFTGITALWFFRGFRALFQQLLGVIKRKIQANRDDQSNNLIHLFLSETAVLMQSQHLASPLFPLDNIAIEAKFLTHPLTGRPDNTYINEPVTNYAIPYVPDYPELSARLGAPALSLSDAVSGNANLVILGHAGSGKTVALANLVMQLSKASKSAQASTDKLPIYVHYADLSLPIANNSFDTLIESIKPYYSGFIQEKIIDVLHKVIQEREVLLFLDGLDELPIPGFDIGVKFIESLLDEFPNLQIIATASFEYIGDLPKFGFVPIAIKQWSSLDLRDFYYQWETAWSQQYGQTDVTHQGIIPEWLSTETSIPTPLEATLKAWAFYAGDLNGGKNRDLYEAYFDRQTFAHRSSHQTLEQVSYYMVRNELPVVSPAYLRLENPIRDNNVIQDGNNNDNSNVIEIDKNQIIPILTKYTELGLVIDHHAERYRLIHPCILAFLAAKALNNSPFYSSIEPFYEQTQTSRWATISILINIRSENANLSPLSDYLETPDELILNRRLFSAAYWLRNAPEQDELKISVLRKLFQLLQTKEFPSTLRARALMELLASKSPGIQVFIKRLLSAQDPLMRQFAAFGCVFTDDISMVNELVTLLTDPNPVVYRSACLALIAIGNRSAIDAISNSMKHGSEDLMRSCAEALSHSLEGQQLLLELSASEDLHVRRAVIHGLQLIDQAWARDKLNSMATEDEQWLVKNGASQALYELSQPDSRIPKSPTLLHELPWLIQYAGEKGYGISPGNSSLEMLSESLTDGNIDQRLAALDAIQAHGITSLTNKVHQLILDEKGEVQDAAYNTLWHLSLIDSNLPDQLS